MPSIHKSEAFGIVLLEAMACGRPVISTKIGTGTSWVNQNNLTGFVVDPKNSKVLAEAINKLLNDKEVYNKFSQNALKRARELNLGNFLNKLKTELETCCPTNDSMRNYN